ncbi:MAG: outer membrane protein [Hyphobacterium sp.]|nr:MAG: outer membrane protein [Hyphobacterium sp.]
MIRAVLVLLIMIAAPVRADEPLARLRGISNADLEARIHEILGTSKASADDEIAMRRDLRTARDRAQRFLRSEGYYAATINGEISSDGRPRLTINAGTAFHLGTLTVESGDREARLIARTAISAPVDNILTADWVLAAEAMGQAALENAGWPDARALPRDVSIDHARDAGDVTFRYESGTFARFGGVELQSTAWRRDFIERLANIETGLPVQRTGIDDYSRRLERLDSVRRARVTLSEPDEISERRALIVALDPAPRHAVEATISLSTSEGAGTSLAWSRRNLFGGDETVTLSAELASLVQSFGARLSLPYWRRIDQRLVLNGGIKTEDTDAFQQNELSAGLDLFRELENDLDLQLGAFVDISKVTDGSGERDINSLRLTSALAFDQRDNPLNPQSGVFATLIMNPGHSFGDTDATYLKTEIRTSAYYPVSDRLVAAARLRLGTIIGASATEMSADQRFYAGGGGSARGFVYQSLSPIDLTGAPAGGLSVTEFSAELRWRGEGRWGAVAFVDTAFANASRTPEFDSLRTGVGLGIRYFLDFAPIRLDVATPLDRRAGEDPLHVYISIGQAF